MSRRRASYREYRPISRETYARAVYGSPRRRRPRPPYLRVVEPEEPEGWQVWLGAVLALVVTVVLGIWVIGRRLLGVL